MRQKLWARLIKGPEVRFISHLDLLGTVEKALRRAQVPIAFSQGYNPHPKIAFAAALPVGMTSSGEYVEFILKEAWPLEYFQGQVNRQFPTGLKIGAVKEVPIEYPALMAVVNMARYQLGLELPQGIKARDFCTLWEEFCQQEKIVVTRQTRKGLRTLNLIPYISGQQVRPEGSAAVRVGIDLKMGPRGSVRPTEVIQAFWSFSSWKGRVIFIHREGLYIIHNDEIHTPLAVNLQRGG